MPPLIKYLIIFSLVLIVFTLFKAFYHLANKQSQPKHVVKFLAIRLGLSIILVLSLLLANQFGLIKPHSLITNNGSHQVEKPTQ